MNLANSSAAARFAPPGRLPVENVYGPPVLVFLFLVMIGRIQEFIPAIQGMRLGNVAFGLAFLVLLLRPPPQPSAFLATKQIRCMLLLYLLGWLSMPFGEWPGASYTLLTSPFLISVLTSFLVVKLLDSPVAIFRAAWGVVLSIGLLGLTTVAEHTGGRAVIAGTAYDSNDLAFIMVLFLPLVYFMAKASAGWRRLLLGAIIVGAIWTIVLTQSRGGFVGLVAVVVCLLLRERARPLAIVTLAGLCWLLMVVAPAEYGDRMATIFNPSEDYNTTASSGRKEVWKRGLAIMLDNPLLGVGPGVFAVAEGASHAEAGGKWSVAHNSLIEIGAELGIPGLCLFLGMLFYSARGLREIRLAQPADNVTKHLASGIEIGLYGFLVSGFFLSQAYAGSLYILIGFATALQTIAGRGASLVPFYNEMVRT